MGMEDWLRGGDPSTALSDVQDQVRKNPANAKLRIFLFQLLAIEGRWDRALTQLKVAGDLHIDGHHSVEDSALALGQAVARALGERRGIVRYGTAYAPMDETLTRVAIDISGRPWLVWKSAFTVTRLGDLDTELVEHWFHSFAQEVGLTLHVENLYGENNHHIVESCFKGLARALRDAVAIDPRRTDAVPSTKGTLGGSLS